MSALCLSRFRKSDLDLVIIVRVVFTLGAGKVCLCGKDSRAEVDEVRSKFVLDNQWA